MSKVRLTGSTSGYTEIQASAVAGDNTLSLPTTTDGTLLASDSSGNVNLDSGTLYVDAANNRVGIGLTNVAAKLDIAHGNELGIYTSGPYNFQAKFESTDSEAAIIIEDSNSTNDGNRIGVIGDNMAFTTANTERARIDSSGRVGIGTTSPATRLDLFGTDCKLRIRDSAQANGLEIYQINADGGSAIYTANNNYLKLGTNNTERARIDASGNFGIGNASAGQKFYVEQSGTSRVAAFHSTNASFGEIIVFSQANRTASTAFHYYFAYNLSTADAEFRVDGQGTVFGDNNYVTGADYAEFFEWQDGNPDNEDRRGYSVVLDGNMIRFALDGEEPIGVISARPSVVGDSAWSRWSGKYITDDFGSFVLDANGDRQLNPDYDPDQPYVPREDRPEWSCVGLMGKLRIRKGQPTGTRWIKMRDISATVEEWLVR